LIASPARTMADQHALRIQTRRITSTYDLPSI
jgi:hypothetical protein